MQHRVRRGPTRRGRTPPGCSRDLAYPRATAFLPETKAHRTAFKEAVFIDATTGEGVWLRPVVATGRAGVPSARAPPGQRWGVPFLGTRGGDSATARESSQRSPCEPRSGGFSPAGLRGRRLRRRGGATALRGELDRGDSTPCSTAMAEVAEVARKEKIRTAIVVVLWEGERRARARAVVVRLVDIGVCDTCYDIQPWIFSIARSSFFEGWVV